jgi:OmpA-OmpF porin, OOP family
MLKKVLTTAVLGVSALSVMAANAAAPGAYVTGQLGYANTHMGNKTEIDTAAFQPTDANVTNLSNNGLAGRLAIGYQFNPNFALEMGYLQLGSKKVKGTGAVALAGVDTLKLSQNAIDLAAKGILPIASNFNVYGKLGVAYLTTTVTAKSPDFSITDNKDGKHKWAPEAALGVSYDITPNVSIDTSWTHIHPVGSNRPGNVDFAAVGLTYNFG